MSKPNVAFRHTDLAGACGNCEPDAPKHVEFEHYVESNFGLTKHGGFDRTLLVMCCGAAGETGEYLEHIKKVMRDYDGDFAGYPNREEALLEFGDALHYLTRLYQIFGFTYEQVVEANMKKLDRRFGRSKAA